MTASAIPVEEPKARKKWGREKIYTNLSYLTMILPGAIWLFLFAYLPMPGIIMAFKTYKLTRPPVDFWIQNKFIYSLFYNSPWVGLNNFTWLTLPTNVGATMMYIRNTVLYNLLFMVVGLVLSVALAVIIYEVTNRFLAKLYHSIFFLPFFISWIVVAYVVYALGSSNGILSSLGGTSIELYRTKAAWPFIFLIANIWRYTGNGSIIYLATITGIDREMYEAAAIDGATKWKQFLYITLPHLIPVIVLLQILAVGRIFGSDFDMFYTLPNGSALVKDVTQTLDVFVYSMLRAALPLGYPAAAAFLQSAVGFILILVTNYIVRKTRPEMALF